MTLQASPLTLQKLFYYIELLLRLFEADKMTSLNRVGKSWIRQILRQAQLYLTYEIKLPCSTRHGSN